MVVGVDELTRKEEGGAEDLTTAVKTDKLKDSPLLTTHRLRKNDIKLAANI